MPEIIIGGTEIDFPNSAASPNWAPAVIDFAEAVESALEGISGQGDITAQTFSIDGASFNPTASPTNIPGLQFSTTLVRSAVIEYNVFRTATTPSETAYEVGTMNIIYNPNGGVGEKWELIRYAAGDGKITFTITDTGQIQFETTQIGTTNHEGKIGFSAKAILQD